MTSSNNIFTTKFRRVQQRSYGRGDFEKVPYAKGIEHFDKLYQAIVKQQPLLIYYKRFDKERATEHVFHPYLLKEYKFRWYLLGL